MLTRWYDTPALHRNMFFQSFFGDDLFQGDRLGAPRFTIQDEGNTLTVRGELPGIANQDLSITVENDTLTISGQRSIEIPEGYRALKRERLPLKFTRSFKVAKEMNLEAAEAKLENGILLISIPKRPETQPRRIPVNAS